MTLLDKYNQLRKENKALRETIQIKCAEIHFLKNWYDKDFIIRKPK